MEPLVQLAIIWAGVFVASVLAHKTRLTSVLYFLAFGAVMVNVGILPTETEPFIRGVAELGIILIMFALGFEENTRNFIRSIKRSWGIAFFGALAPFFTAYFVADYFWDDTRISIMCGLTMTATAVSLTMVSLKGLGLQTSHAAMGIMTSAVLDDIASLALVAVLVPLATGQATLDPVSISLIVGKALLFFGGVALVSAYLLPHDLEGWVAKIPLIGRFGARDLLHTGDGEHSTLTVMLMALVVGLLAHEFGFHPAVGAYMAGLILREEYFLFDPKRARESYKETKAIVDNAAFSWVGPVFFVDLGTKIVLDWDIFVSIIPESMTLLVGLFFAQIISAAAAARYTGNFTFHESMLIGFGMLGRAELAFVVMDIAYIQNNILSTEAFYTLMFTAFWLNVAVPVTITLWKPRYDRAQQALEAQPP
ncbi:MAG: cation:proton antiporter [Chromatiales bacterium]|nr:MAG: cation:proton antiporter [Chromatiales bacterium]